MKTPRGINNNNPANIRRGSAWKGLVPFLINPQNQQRVCDKSFCQFENIEYGIRALIVLLRTYSYKYKLRTIETIIRRYAPPSENRTNDYIDFVVNYCQHLYYPSSVPVYPQRDCLLLLFHNPKEPTFICRCLMKAICKQESGFVLTDELIDKAIRLL